MPSAVCRNPRHFKTCVERTETNYFLGWKPVEVWWHCKMTARRLGENRLGWPPLSLLADVASEKVR